MKKPGRLYTNMNLLMPMSGQKNLLLCLLCVLGLSIPAGLVGQMTSDTLPYRPYDEPKEYEIGGIKVSGAFFSDENAIKSVSGLQVGDIIRVPGQDIPRALRALWKLRLFTDVQILQDKMIGDVIFLEIVLEERGRLTGWSYKGVKQGGHADLNDVLKPFLIKGQIITEAMKINSVNALEEYYKEKGFLDSKISVTEVNNERRTNAVNLVFDIQKNERVKIDEIVFEGNPSVKDKRLRKAMKNTKKKGTIFSRSKLVIEDFEEDKRNIIAYYHTIGHRDAQVVSDSIWRDEDGELHLKLNIEEGNRYYFRNISWKGNSIYDDKQLTTVLGIKKGDVFNEELLETRLRFSIDGRDISSLYLDDGYLFFNVEPTEVAVVNDSIDIEMRIFEGPQATIDQVVIKGNDRTHEHVIRRELRTKPGQKFSRSDIIRSQRQIMALGYFNPETMDIQTPVDQNSGTVDIIYTLEERPSDQLELSAGWGGFGTSRVIGTLGVTFNNFSLRNIFNAEAWRPLPQGDGQKLSIRAQTNGDAFQSYNFSFTDPWLGGKRPNSFTLGGVLTQFDNSFFGGGKLSIGRAFVGLGSRLRWPDDNFVTNTTLNIENIRLTNYFTGDFTDMNGNSIGNGDFNNFSITQTIARTTISEPIFPTGGSKVSLTLQITPPYSLLGRDFDVDDPQNLYKFIEYHKWRFDADWYAPITGKLVLRAAAKMGYLGFYNKKIGAPPFERFEVGGDGLSNQQVGIFGKDIIAMRGYEVEDIPASRGGGATVFNKFTVELRYPLSTNPNSTIFVMGFMEGGNAWSSFQEYNPFDLKRSVGIGMRVFLPMFGLLGFDYGYGFDNDRLLNAGARWSEFGNFNIVLGFEPD